jgi:hypothetical protein
MEKRTLIQKIFNGFNHVMPRICRFLSWTMVGIVGLFLSIGLTSLITPISINWFKSYIQRQALQKGIRVDFQDLHWSFSNNLSNLILKAKGLTFQNKAFTHHSAKKPRSMGSDKDTKTGEVPIVGQQDFPHETQVRDQSPISFPDISAVFSIKNLVRGIVFPKVLVCHHARLTFGTTSDTKSSKSEQDSRFLGTLIPLLKYVESLRFLDTTLHVHTGSGFVQTLFSAEVFRTKSHQESQNSHGPHQTGDQNMHYGLVLSHQKESLPRLMESVLKKANTPKTLNNRKKSTSDSVRSDKLSSFDGKNSDSHRTLEIHLPKNSSDPSLSAKLFKKPSVLSFHLAWDTFKMEWNPFPENPLDGALNTSEKNTTMSVVLPSFYMDGWIDLETLGTRDVAWESNIQWNGQIQFPLGIFGQLLSSALLRPDALASVSPQQQSSDAKKKDGKEVASLPLQPLQKPFSGSHSSGVQSLDKGSKAFSATTQESNLVKKKIPSWHLQTFHGRISTKKNKGLQGNFQIRLNDVAWVIDIAETQWNRPNVQNVLKNNKTLGNPKLAPKKNKKNLGQQGRGPVFNPKLTVPLATTNVPFPTKDLPGPLKAALEKNDLKKRILECRIKAQKIPIHQLKVLWPRFLSPDAFDWVTQNFRKGDIQQLELLIQFKKNLFARSNTTSVASSYTTATAYDEKSWTFQQLKGSFALKETQLRYLKGMPWIEHLNAQCTFGPSDLDIHITSGTFPHHDLGPSQVYLYDFSNGPGMIRIDAQLNSKNIGKTLLLLKNDPLHYMDHLPLFLEKTNGFFSGKLFLKFPLDEQLLKKHIEYKIEGHVKNLDMPLQGYPLRLHKSNLKLALDSQKMLLEGKGNLNDFPGKFRWEQDWNHPKKSYGSFQGRGTITQLAKTLSLPSLENFGKGLIHPTIIYKPIQNELSYTLDCRNTHCNIPFLKWQKKSGLAFKGHGKTTIHSKGARGNLFLKGSGVGINLQTQWQKNNLRTLSLGVNYGKSHLEINLDQTRHQLKIKGQKVDLKGLVTPESFPENTALASQDTEKNNSYPKTPGAGSYKQLHFSKNKTQTVHHKKTFPAQSPSILKQMVVPSFLQGMKLHIDIRNGLLSEGLLDHLKGDLMFSKHPGAFPIAQGNIALLILKGRNKAKEKSVVSFLKITSKDLIFNSPNAGLLLKNFGIYNGLKGGECEFKGTIDHGALKKSTLKIRNFHTKSAFFLRLLSIASPQFLLGVFNTQGIPFDKFHAKFTYAYPYLNIEKAGAKGISLGLKSKGRINLETNQMDWSGHLIPAYFFNSLLMSLPVVSFFSSLWFNKDGGLMATKFHMKGPLEDPKISINFIDSFAPEFLKKFLSLFDGPEKKEI